VWIPEHSSLARRLHRQFNLPDVVILARSAAGLRPAQPQSYLHDADPCGEICCHAARPRRVREATDSSGQAGPAGTGIQLRRGVSLSVTGGSTSVFCPRKMAAEAGWLGAHPITTGVRYRRISENIAGINRAPLNWPCAAPSPLQFLRRHPTGVSPRLPTVGLPARMTELPCSQGAKPLSHRCRESSPKLRTPRPMVSGATIAMSYRGRDGLYWGREDRQELSLCAISI
jgi:hypothetical protein